MRILKLFKRNKVTKQEVESEAEYYEKLFVKNSRWNTPNPNKEETSRWLVIESFVKLVKDEIGEIENEKFEILDLGCGRGWLTKLLHNYGNVTGIEPVKNVVDHAIKMFPKINFLVGSTKDLLSNLPKPKYNLIVSSEVIEHIPNDEKKGFINDIYELLDEKGYLILTTPRKEAQEEWLKHLSPDQPIEDWISEKELESLVSKNKFDKIEKKTLFDSPVQGGPKIEIYQLWLFKKK